jgi:hypothetical protein
MGNKNLCIKVPSQCHFEFLPVTGHIGATNGGEFTLEFILCHAPPPWSEG